MFEPHDIRLIRETLRESRREFGERFYVSEHTVKAWENGTRNPFGPTVILLDHYRKEAEAVKAARINLMKRALRK